MQKKLIVRYLFATLSVGVMLLIFFFSAQNGETSGDLSAHFAATLKDVLSPMLSPDTVTLLIQYVRKGAHVFLYALLGVFVSVFVFTFSCKRKILLFIIPLAICFLYACMDEWHQTFVEGRDGKVTDVLVDAIGFVSTTLIANVVRLLIDRIKRKKSGVTEK